MGDFGIRISKEGFNVSVAPTTASTKYFQLLSTEDCLLEKEKSSSSSETNVFLGYKLTDTNTVAHPLNYTSGTAVYVIYENEL